MRKDDIDFMKIAIQLARKGMHSNSGGPFGAIVVKDGNIISEGFNCVTSKNDPTAHAEIIAIRKACEKLNDFQLHGCTLYTSCEPCPMCLGAIYWARPDRVVYACNREDAANINFDDQFIYDELGKKITNRKIVFNQLLRDDALATFNEWSAKKDRMEY